MSQGDAGPTVETHWLLDDVDVNNVTHIAMQLTGTQV
jgi:hypothetical protein